jgi:hypothetical protein
MQGAGSRCVLPAQTAWQAMLRPCVIAPRPTALAPLMAVVTEVDHQSN